MPETRKKRRARARNAGLYDGLFPYMPPNIGARVREMVAHSMRTALDANVLGRPAGQPARHKLTFTSANGDRTEIVFDLLAWGYKEMNSLRGAQKRRLLLECVEVETRTVAGAQPQRRKRRRA